MPRKSQRQPKSEETHTQIAIKVQRYDARIEASINRHVYAPQYAWNLDDRDPLNQFTSQLAITGVAIYPKERAGHAYDLTIHGDDAPSQRHDLTLQDVQARDAYGAPKYREYRGKQIPIYNAPKGMGLLDKVRAELRWTGWLFVRPWFVSDALSLLSQRTEVFIAMHERKVERRRWIRSLTLQTSNPSEE